MGPTVRTYIPDAATRQELGLLAVMEALSEQEQVSQRELAQRTGLNLKKVNHAVHVHELLGRGYVKFRRAVHSANERAYLYVLTPAGLAAKTRLTYWFVSWRAMASRVSGSRPQNWRRTWRAARTLAEEEDDEAAPRMGPG